MVDLVHKIFEMLKGALGSPKIYAAETTDEWAELSGILDSNKGIYTKETKVSSPRVKRPGFK